MLIRRLRQVEGYDPDTGAVSYFGDLAPNAAPRIAGPALEQYAPFTDVVKVRDARTGGWSYFLAEVVGAPGTEATMSSSEAAALLGVEDRTVRRWAAAGKLEAVRSLGGEKRQGSWKVTVASVRALLGDDADLRPQRPVRRERKPKIVEEASGQLGFV